MKIVVVYGSPRKKGNTHRMAQIFKEEMSRSGEVEFTEFFLPDALPAFCGGCMNCFNYGREKCSNAQYTLPILDALLEADAFIFTTPVFVLQASGGMKNFFDHFGHIFIVHRAEEAMFKKKAFVLSSTAGAGLGAAIKTVDTNLKFWGVNRVYSRGVALHAVEWERMSPKRKARIERKIKKDAIRFYKEVAKGKKRRAYLTPRVVFRFMRRMIKTYDDTSLDKQYWQEKNWFKVSPFRKERNK